MFTATIDQPVIGAFVVQINGNRRIKCESREHAEHVLQCLNDAYADGREDAMRDIRNALGI